jgi:hypothetical protein
MTANGANTWSRRGAILAAAIAAIGLAGAARAYPVTYADAVDLKVVDRDTGQPLRVWRHDGRLFIAGEPGARYGLRVTNHTDGRVLVVLSVDGVNILTGETASYDQRGYVFDPHESYDLNGWRKSNTEIAAFAFAPLPQSYAALTGRPGEVGVIGMAVFKERAAPPPQAVAPAGPAWRDQTSRGAFRRFQAPPERRPAPAPPAALTAQPAPVAAPERSRAVAADAVTAGRIAEQDEKLGTAHGAREWSVVNITTFERATPYPQSVRQVEYDTYANLVASGVIPAPPPEDHRPRPFPMNPDGGGYVPDPPG